MCTPWTTPNNTYTYVISVRKNVKCFHQQGIVRPTNLFLLQLHQWPRYQYRCRRSTCTRWICHIVISSVYIHKIIICVRCACLSSSNPRFLRVLVCVYPCDQLQYCLYFSYQEIWCFCPNHSDLNILHQGIDCTLKSGYWVLSNIDLLGVRIESTRYTAPILDFRSIIFPFVMFNLSI